MQPVWKRLSVAWVMVLFAAATVIVPLAAPAQADPCGAGGNPVACENSKPGTPQSVWDSGTGDASIEGFATDTSVNLGAPSRFKVKTPASTYHLDIYRIGLLRGQRGRG